MGTITKKVIQFSSYDDILKHAGQQVTAQQLINGRMYLKDKGWTDVEISHELRAKLATDISDKLGGRYTTREQVKNTILWGRPQHWGLQRVFLEKYGEGQPFITYCAGQDHVLECNAIRTALK